MPAHFRAIITDYDGTLTREGPPGGDVRAALREAREAGRRVVLATGRILADLRRHFPEVDACFDAIVAENGAVLSLPGGPPRLLAPPVPDALAELLAGRGVPIERGEVLLATGARYDAEVERAVARLGLDCHLAHNRGALMVLPAGVTKASGVREALGELGVSHHSAVAVGDAENDHTLLESAELGVAVADAVPALREHADLVLAGGAGAGVAELLRGPYLAGQRRVHPRRWQIDLGTASRGARVLVPASQVNLLVVGEVASGKSHLAGLIAERLLGLGYSIAVIDPEGDHVGLGALRGVVVLGGSDRRPGDLTRFVRHRFGSVVVDLSQVAWERRAEHYRMALDELCAIRGEHGLPHWIIADEGHLGFGRHVGTRACLRGMERGLCLVSYHPEELPPETLEVMDALLVTSSGAAVESHLPSPARAAARELRPGETLLWRRTPVDELVPFTAGVRRTSHVRHRHKYAEAQVPQARRFLFRNGRGPTGASAGNLAEFVTELERSEPAVLSHHGGHHDFSRWAREVLSDFVLAGALRDLESAPLDPESMRRRIVALVRERYL